MGRSDPLALALVGAAWLAKPPWPGRVLALILAAGVGWSRVYLGVHWTTDVLAGWLIATAWITLILWLPDIGTQIERRRREARVDPTERGARRLP